MNKEKSVSILNDLIFHSIIPGAEVGSAYKSNVDNMITSINNAIQYFGLSDYELGEVIRCGDHGYLTFPGLVKSLPFETQSQDDATISKENTTLEWDDNELEELRAEALNSAQLVKSIEWLRSKNISAEDIGDFVKYVCE